MVKRSGRRSYIKRTFMDQPSKPVLNSDIRRFRWVILGCAFLGLGLSMPSCPGQQGLQQQIDALQTKNAAAEQSLQQLTQQTKALSDRLTETEGKLTEANNLMQMVKTKLDKVDESVIELMNRPAPRSAASAPKATKAAAKAR